ncbi:hypothetical protein C8R43DRAFT_903511 [Mycena crocata]|nr:hypothetical protein C8R43DRAFT_903511 [Mycena crocata]
MGQILSSCQHTVRLGNSGLRVSQIILGCMSYGSSKWRPWTLDEEEGIKHIKYAYVSGFLPPFLGSIIIAATMRESRPSILPM